jgi:hypothetical protein
MRQVGKNETMSKVTDTHDFTSPDCLLSSLGSEPNKERGFRCRFRAIVTERSALGRICEEDMAI